MKEAIKLTENYLESLVPYVNNNILSGEFKWAFVGGFVRDTLMSFLLDKEITSPDIDIAVFGELPKLSLNDEITNIRHNTFGGIKVHSSKYGNIDIWSLNCFYDDKSKNIDWIDYLTKIDFSINSVVYSYPELKLFLHREWFFSFENRKVSVLYENSPSPELQLIRAIALASKLSLETGVYFKTSQGILNKLNALLKNKNINSYQKLIDYTTDKVITKRWPDSVLTELLDLKISIESY
jgi:hypothetical protein